MYMIFGVTGQDGSTLADMLLAEGERVIGIKRRCSTDNTQNLVEAVKSDRFSLVEGDVTDAASISHIIGKYKPEYVINTSAQSHVYTSFDQPTYTFQVNATGVLNLLEAIRVLSPETRFITACHDTQTQILTPDGIKSYKDVKIGDLVYTINETTRELELKPIKHIHEYDYDGEMILIQSQTMSQCVTPNHRILVQNNNKIEGILARDLYQFITDNKINHYTIPNIQYYTIGINKSTKKYRILSHHINNIQYTGKVWCLEVEDNHNFAIVRNNKICFSGNSSSEMFGSNNGTLCIVGQNRIYKQNEETPLLPNSPYGVSKVAAHYLCRVYRQSYGIFAATSWAFNHEGPRRGHNFVTRKISDYVASVAIAKKYKMKISAKLKLGNINACRDWGHARDVCDAVLRIVRADKPDDFVVATGEVHSVRELLEIAFGRIGERWEDYVEIDKNLLRPLDVEYLCGDYTKIKSILGWEPKTSFTDLIIEMVDHDINEKEKTHKSSSLSSS